MIFTQKIPLLDLGRTRHQTKKLKDNLSVRNKHTILHSKQGRSNSSQRWLQRQHKDPFVWRAQVEKYRSRAAYKLLDIDQKFALLKNVRSVVDIGCAPGGWLQVLHRKIVGKALLIGIDILPIEPITNVTILCGNICTKDIQQSLWYSCKERGVDLLLSDMAASMTGHKFTDQMNIITLAETAWKIAQSILIYNGHFVCKVYAGGMEQQLLEDLKINFNYVRYYKPKASRKESREIYLVALHRNTIPTLLN